MVLSSDSNYVFVQYCRKKACADCSQEQVNPYELVERSTDPDEDAEAVVQLCKAKFES